MVIHLKHIHNYNSVHNLWRHQSNKKLSFSLYLLGRTYRTALQQMLQKSSPPSQKQVAPFKGMFCATLPSVSVGNSPFNIVFHFLQSLWFI
jgi:hypothetical protein